jgi:hypothetical protein
VHAFYFSIAVIKPPLNRAVNVQKNFNRATFWFTDTSFIGSTSQNEKVHLSKVSSGQSLQNKGSFQTLESRLCMHISAGAHLSAHMPLFELLLSLQIECSPASFLINSCTRVNLVGIPNSIKPYYLNFQVVLLPSHKFIFQTQVFICSSGKINLNNFKLIDSQRSQQL